MSSRHTCGVRGLVCRRPLAVFFGIVFGIGWPVLSVPLLADRSVIATGPLPAELFALGVTWFLMLPVALWVTAVSEGPPAARHLLRRLLQWRLGAWWAVIMLALPAATLGVGLLLGGFLGTDDASPSLLQGLVLLVTAVLLIHLWEETVWAGFVQTRLERRHSLVVAALLTAVPFAAIHVPIILIGESDIASALGGVLVLGVAMRLLVGVFLRGTGGSLLAAGVVHGVYNACNNNGALVDGMLQGADQNLAAPIALVVVTAAAAAAINHRNKPGPGRRRRHDAGQDGTRDSRRRLHQPAEAGAAHRGPHTGRPRRTSHLEEAMAARATFHAHENRRKN